MERIQGPASYKERWGFCVFGNIYLLYISGSGPSVNKYREISEARKLLELPERATMGEIKVNYKNLMKKWHPDRHKEAKAKCTKMTAKIIAAYGLIMDYCNHYKFSFSKEEVRYHLSEEEWWMERFGSDTHWGKQDTGNDDA
jgi:preprotein translocase subunit Sec63